MTATFIPYTLHFKRPGGTSRGVLNTKETYLLKITQNGETGTGECGLFRGLSYDDVPDYEEKLQWLCDNINAPRDLLQKELIRYPSIWFGYEQAVLNLEHGDDVYFPSDFTAGKSSIKINGLIWMGDSAFMEEQIQEKLAAGFNCLKLKIGAAWNTEKKILHNLRKKFPEDRLELRVDANGGFNFDEAKKILEELYELQIHSVEQPIKPGNRKEMHQLSATTRTPIALDEELIGIVDDAEKRRLLEEIQPQYIILKPSLIGGFSGSDDWISLAENLGIGWWITSALESNIGLTAIAQYTYTKKPKIPQGLGTGGLFTNNFETRLQLSGDLLSIKKV